jgi:hypothetical protein
MNEKVRFEYRSVFMSFRMYRSVWLQMGEGEVGEEGGSQ